MIKGNKVAPSDIEGVSQPKNKYYALWSKCDQEWSPYVPLCDVFFNDLRKLPEFLMIIIVFSDFEFPYNEELMFETHVLLVYMLGIRSSFQMSLYNYV